MINSLPKNRANRGSNIVAVGAYNERLVLSILRSKGSLSKVELTQATGLSKQTVTDVIGRLEANGLLLKGDPVRGRIGQPQVPFLLNPDGAYSIGFKIGRKSYELVLMDFAGAILKLHRQHIDYPTPTSMVTFVDDALQTLRREILPSIMEKVVGMGVAMPNELWRWGQEFDAPDDEIASWKTFNVQAELEKSISLPVMISNDVAAACNGELIFGQGAKASDFLYVYLGTFIGGGLVLNGKIVSGSRQNAGAIGSMLIADGRSGSEARQLLSVASIISLVHDLTAHDRDTSPIWAPDDDWTSMNAHVLPWVEHVASHLASACINAAAIADVPQIIIDGSLPPRVRALIVESVRVKTSTLPTTGLSDFAFATGTLGYSARVVGAASLPMQARFANDWDTLLKAEPLTG